MSPNAAAACAIASPHDFPLRWPRRYRAMAEALGPGSPLLRAIEAAPEERLPDPDALPDPTGDRRLRPLPFVVRKHADRVVVLASSRCFCHCRFCFRRQELGGAWRAGASDWERITRWLQERAEVEEVILSGGDPLTLPERRLCEITQRMSASPHLRRWRIHTRAPVVLPERITESLLEALKGCLPLRVVLHAVHPAECDYRTADAIARLRRGGAEVLSQSVLLAGVNDRPDVLAALWNRLAALGAPPKYLHHPDRAAGNAAFRLPLARGMELYRQAVQACDADLEVPPYVVDLPNGAGKAEVRSLEQVSLEAKPGATRKRWRWRRPATWDAVVPDTRFEWWDVWEGPAPA